MIVHVLTFIGPSTSINDEVYMTMAFGSKLALAIMPNVGLWWGIKILSIEEGKGSGLQWNTLFDRQVVRAFIDLDFSFEAHYLLFERQA